MIVRIHFSNRTPMLFGNSYKPWDMQVREFFYTYPDFRECVILIEKCKDKWVSWGGLKWCTETNFQEYLNREGVQQHEEDNPKARKFSEMVFTEAPNLIKKISAR